MDMDKGTDTVVAAGRLYNMMWLLGAMMKGRICIDQIDLSTQNRHSFLKER